MKKQLVRICLSAAVSGGLALGCRSTSTPTAYPDQPLLLSKTPVEGTIETVPTDRLAVIEPSAPSAPAEALASIPEPTPPMPSIFTTAPAGLPTREAPTTSEPPLATLEPPLRTASRPKAPVVATPAVRSTERDTQALTAATAPRTAGTYGHDAEYRWIQGVLDKHYRGHLYLRYCDPTVEDRWGGKVCLEPDPRLAQFKEGDVLLIEGSLSPESPVRKSDTWKQYPHYRVRTVTLIEHK